jgi:hypothetical protein
LWKIERFGGVEGLLSGRLKFLEGKSVKICGEIERKRGENRVEIEEKQENYKKLRKIEKLEEISKQVLLEIDGDLEKV